MSIPKQHRAARFINPQEDLQVVTVDTPSPKEHEVLLKVSASGICWSDSVVQNNVIPGINYPKTPGHEVIGTIVQLGPGVHDRWAKGQLVGVGWNGGYCGYCAQCRKGHFKFCERGWVTGVTLDGGHQEYVVVKENALVCLPKELKMSRAELAPLLCAGLTVFDALKASNAKPGDVCVIQGIGGLGHLAIQFARKIGLHVVAVSGGSDKAKLAKDLGAHHYVESSKLQDYIKSLGGAQIAIATAPNSAAITSLLPALAKLGKLYVVGIPHDDMKINPAMLVTNNWSVHGLICGTATGNEECLDFSHLSGTKPMVNTFSIDDAAKAYDEVQNGRPKFRNVIVFE